MSGMDTNADNPRKNESTEHEDGLLKVFADDWQIIRQRKIEFFFLVLIVAQILCLLTGLDVCPAWQSHLIQTYVCENPFRSRLLWSGYIGYAITSVIFLCVRDYRLRKTGALVMLHLITGEDFYKILFDGIKNSAVAVALGTTVVHVLKGMESSDWRTDRAWFADFIPPSLPLTWFLVGVAIAWLVAATLLFAANAGMRCSYYRLCKSIAEKRKLNESARDIFRHSLLRSFCAGVFYTEFFCFLGVAVYQLSTTG